MTTVYGTEFGRSSFGNTGVIGRVEATEAGNVAVSVGHLNEAGWEKTGHVTLTGDEALACAVEMIEAVCAHDGASDVAVAAAWLLGRPNSENAAYVANEAAARAGLDAADTELGLTPHAVVRIDAWAAKTVQEETF